MNMYFGTILLSLIGIAFSWWKFRDALHPHFVLTIIMFFMFFSDFLVRGYEDKNIINIDIERVQSYQTVILITVSAIYLSTYFLLQYFTKPRPKRTINLLSFMISEDRNSTQLLPLFAWSILGLELVKRLYFSGWSVSLMLAYSFGPRFNRPWASASGAVGDDKFMFALVGILLPLAGLIFGSGMINAKKLKSIIASATGYFIILALTIGVGSRTPAVILIILPLIYYLRKTPSRVKQVMAIVLVGCMLTTVTSVIYNTRDHGLLSAEKSAGEAVYHQDDSYYRAISTMNMVSQTYERWDLVPFVGASLLNFIPRAVWPEKPTLTQEYWGSFKLDYVTITFIAELAALFGITGGAIVSVLVGIVGFFFLLSLYRRIYSSYDLLLYILGNVYIYMVFRSLLNITQFVYMLLFFSIVLRIDKKLAAEKQKRMLRTLYR